MIDADHPPSALDPPFADGASLAGCLLGETVLVYGERSHGAWIRSDTPVRPER
ncbi:hypothetical protein [Natronorarus salvus]|uniref:hypothetical protein n=1 Tax=Natronorarus salvus TaxID=3117733 RepID=UPI002F26AED9